MFAIPCLLDEFFWFLFCFCFCLVFSLCACLPWFTIWARRLTLYASQAQKAFPWMFEARYKLTVTIPFFVISYLFDTTKREKVVLHEIDQMKRAGWPGVGVGMEGVVLGLYLWRLDRCRGQGRLCETLLSSDVAKFNSLTRLLVLRTKYQRVKL